MNTELKAQFERELLNNILPFWIDHAVDKHHGGFFGALTNRREAHNDMPRSSVICSRILWTYSAAYRIYRKTDFLHMAQHAYDYLFKALWDGTYDGVFWQIDADRQPTMDRKHSYAQSFAMYGLSEHHRATGDTDSMNAAQQLFDLLEVHAYDGRHAGYIEGCARNWGALEDMRLSDKEPNCRKSMNTLLHIMEGYTNLYRIWPVERVKEQLSRLVNVIFDQVIDPNEHRFKLFFDDTWQQTPGTEHIVSYGHDIEGAWMLQATAEALHDAALIQRARANAVLMADAVLKNGLAGDGSVLYQNETSGSPDWNQKHWWAQAEAVVGFYNAYQVSGEQRFFDAAMRCWQVIQTQFVDKEHGEWFKVLDANGVPVAGQLKIGPWECPYHHARMCMEMAARLS